MPDLTSMIQNGGNSAGTPYQNPYATTGGASDPNYALQQTTGLTMDLASMIAPIDAIPPQDPVPVVNTMETIRELTPEEIASLNHTTRVDVESESMQRQDARVAKILESKDDDLINMMSGALAEEDARLQRHEAALEDPETAKAIIGQNASDGKVRYTGEAVPRNQEKRSIVDTFNEYDDDDLVPGYEADTAPKTVNQNVIDIETQTPVVEAEEESSDISAYRDYIKSLSIVSFDESATSPVKTSRELFVTAVPSNRGSAKNLGDQAFLNSINKFKSDNFSVITVPLPNSGFTVDVVGTGVVDLTQLYTELDENTAKMDYEIEKMKVVIKNVVGTHPKINPADLKNLIHFQDYKMMAYAHVCATLREVEIATNCDTCGHPYRISSKPVSLLLNEEKFRDRANIIQAAQSVNDVSLMSMNRKIVTENGFEVVLGHPSYAEALKMMHQVKEYAGSMDPLETHRFKAMIDVLFMVRKLFTPTNVAAINIFQIYTAFKMFSEDDRKIISNEIMAMSKDVIIPEFGIRSVECPHCKHVNTNIRYESLEDMVFTHTQLSNILSYPED